MDDNYEKILWEGYGLHFLGGNRVRTGYLCKTEKGILEVRKSITPSKQILFEHDHLESPVIHIPFLFCRIFSPSPLPGCLSLCQPPVKRL